MVGALGGSLLALYHTMVEQPLHIFSILPFVPKHEISQLLIVPAEEFLHYLVLPDCGAFIRN